MSVTGILAGSTGLVGSHILTTLTSHSKFNNVYAYTRRKLPVESSKLHTIETSETDSWPSKFPSGGAIFFSGLGSTRGQAGGLENQRKIDYDLNMALAKAAKEAGVEVYVLISVVGANAASMFPYVKMKGQLEDDVRKLGFKHTVIVRPVVISGERQGSRPTEYILTQIANLSGKISGNTLKDFWAQDGDVIAKAAVDAGMQCLEGKREPGVWFVGASDIIRLGRTEWSEEKAASS